MSVQSTLNNFFGSMPAGRPLMLADAVHSELEPRFVDDRYTLFLKKNNIIEIQELHCKDCGSRLINNGFNMKVPVLDNGLGKRKYRIHRKQCPRCGEIRPNYSCLASYHAHYHETYKRRAREHYMNGLSISRIKKILRVDFNINIPFSTLMKWIVEIEKPLRKLVSTTRLPLSGYLHHDETFARAGGQQVYVLTTIDADTGFAPGATVSTRNDRTTHKNHFNVLKRPNGLKIISLIADGTKTYESLFKTRYLKDAKRCQCVMHFKWRVMKALKKFAGCGENAWKKLPEPYLPFRQAFYNVFDSPDETHAYIALERLRWFVTNANKRFLTTLFNDIEARLSQIIAWQRDPRIPKTNNACEKFNQSLQYHVSFNGRCKNIRALQRIADCGTYIRNRANFSKYLMALQQRVVKYKAFAAVKPFDKTLVGQGGWLTRETKSAIASLEKYKAFSRQYLTR